MLDVMEIQPEMQVSPYMASSSLFESVGKNHYSSGHKALGSSSYLLADGSSGREEKRELRQLCSEILLLSLFFLLVFFSFS